MPIRETDPVKAAVLLREGRLVAFPTETVYGLGADALQDRAVASVFAAKNRPHFNPLILHVTDLEAAAALVELGPLALRLGERFWPGPLTLVGRRRAGCGVSLLAGAGLDTLAVRVPDHPLALALLVEFARPVAAPSANRSGSVSPTTAEHVVDSLGDRVAMVLEGGACRVGLESTVLDLSGETPVLLRPGGVPLEAIEMVVGRSVAFLSGETEEARPRSPGLSLRHYAPGRPVRLDVDSVAPGEVLLGFGGTPGAALDLSPTGDLTEAAANLFAMLRRLDHGEARAIAVAPIPEEGLGRAINDRLRRAAAP
ncbi:MAG: L-threonylcarbamoyladenylate synthase [Alphaproteobacteria bacterium]